MIFYVDCPDFVCSEYLVTMVKVLNAENKVFHRTAIATTTTMSFICMAIKETYSIAKAF